MNFTVYRISDGMVVRSGLIDKAGDIPHQVSEGDGHAVVAGIRGIPGKQLIVDGELVDRQPDTQEVKDRALSRVALRRWEIETGGVNGIDTDDRSKLLLSAAAQKARLDPQFTTRWKTAGGWIAVDAPSLIAIEEAVFTHVSNCFAREEQLAELVNACESIQEVAALTETIEQFWP